MVNGSKLRVTQCFTPNRLPLALIAKPQQYLPQNRAQTDRGATMGAEVFANGHGR
jgi:hypothetical protein